MTILKYCGLFRKEDILAANRIRPDYIGFILANKGHRKIDPKKASELKSLLDPSIRAIGVFINEKPETVVSLWKEGMIDGVQLHGKEDNQYIENLRALAQTELLIIQAFAIRSPEDLQAVHESKADLVLLDSRDSGSGKRFDWSVLNEVKRPYVLAGGIDEGNVLEALQHHPLGLDISSGIETNKRKDPFKMERLADIIRRKV